jgi:hypothetical protein
MKSTTQLFLTTVFGFGFGCALMYDERQLMIVAGALSAMAFFAAYSILFVAHAIYKRLRRPLQYDDDFSSESMLGFDSHGKLKIESSYPHR